MVGVWYKETARCAPRKAPNMDALWKKEKKKKEGGEHEPYVF